VIILTRGPSVPGYEPFLLCDFHVHTRWSDGRLSLREVIDLYGATRRFDVIAITDHILAVRFVTICMGSDPIQMHKIGFVS